EGMAGQQDGVEFHCRHAHEQGLPAVGANDVFGGNAMDSRRAQARNGLAVHDQSGAVRGEENCKESSEAVSRETLSACRSSACRHALHLLHVHVRQRARTQPAAMVVIVAVAFMMRAVCGTSVPLMQ